MIILRVTYGYTPRTPEDKFLVNGFTALEHFAQCATPGMWLVDVLPNRKTGLLGAVHAKLKVFNSEISPPLASWHFVLKNCGNLEEATS